MTIIKIEKPVFYRINGEVLQLLSYSTESNTWQVFNTIKGFYTKPLKEIDFNKISFSFEKYSDKEASEYIKSIIYQNELAVV